MIDPTIVNPQLRAFLSPPLIARPEAGLGPGAPGGAGGVEGGKSFGDMLKDSIAEVNRLQTEADVAIGQMVTGEKPDIHSTLIALQKADLSFQVMMEVRNKILTAYQDLLKMS